MKQKPIAQRIGEFLEGKGFYIVLSLCVAAIGISGYYLFSTLSRGSGEAAVSAPGGSEAVGFAGPLSVAADRESPDFSLSRPHDRTGGAPGRSSPGGAAL